MSPASVATSNPATSAELAISARAIWALATLVARLVSAHSSSTAPTPMSRKRPSNAALVGANTVTGPALDAVASTPVQAKSASSVSRLVADSTIDQAVAFGGGTGTIVVVVVVAAVVGAAVVVGASVVGGSVVLVVDVVDVVVVDELVVVAGSVGGAEPVVVDSRTVVDVVDSIDGNVGSMVSSSSSDAHTRRAMRATISAARPAMSAASGPGWRYHGSSAGSSNGGSSPPPPPPPPGPNGGPGSYGPPVEGIAVVGAASPGGGPAGITRVGSGSRSLPRGGRGSGGPVGSCPNGLGSLIGPSSQTAGPPSGLPQK